MAVLETLDAFHLTTVDRDNDMHSRLDSASSRANPALYRGCRESISASNHGRSKAR